jgi:ubiquitin-activating enzyme E1
LSGVCNALDNIPARLFSDEMCVRYRRPLLESGMLGTQASFQVCMPDVTEHYGAQRDFEQRSVPMCTIHHFPKTIEHTIIWARDTFAGLFAAGERPENVEKWARGKFDEFFNSGIRELLERIPRDGLGLLFWGEGTPPPIPIEFDPAVEFHRLFVHSVVSLRQQENVTFDGDNETHLDFIYAAANIRAMNYSIEPRDRTFVHRLAGDIIPAIATTSAMVCGLVALEMYKVHAAQSKTEAHFRSGSINLGANLFALSNPRISERVQCSANGRQFTIWDSWPVEGDLTVSAFFRTVTQKYSVKTDLLSTGQTLIYSSTVLSGEMQQRLRKKISQILAIPASQNQIFIDAVCKDASGAHVSAPRFVLILRPKRQLGLRR